jgi:chromosomal replication initiation ATPase DnaA
MNNLNNMKVQIFQNYVDKVSEVFGLSEKEMFTKTKKRDIVDARHLLYYLCYTRPMRLKYIQDYMSEKGYHIKHSTIIHGINIVEEKIKEDRDYKKVIERIA